MSISVATAAAEHASAAPTPSVHPGARVETRPRRRLGLTSNTWWWVAQAGLAVFFIAASGAPKLLLPAEALPMPIPLPQACLWFIGTAEVLGGLGLVLPGITRRERRLTPIAAICLVLLTVCAAGYQLLGQQPVNAGMALVFGALCGAVAMGRARWLRG